VCKTFSNDPLEVLSGFATKRDIGYLLRSKKPVDLAAVDLAAVDLAGLCAVRWDIKCLKCARWDLNPHILSDTRT
jgi:hypothetical protein|tara:strand:+ start:218 stop:442 length:225 start_codon:yes stop_codon:yes gene_type:complete